MEKLPRLIPTAKKNNMKQHFRIEDGNLIIGISVPLKTKRSNPYDEDEGDEMNNIVGVVAGDELSFCYWIDMGYKGKSDQISMPFFIYDGEEKDFIELCKSLNIDTFKYDTCSKCHKVIYGSSTWSDGGSVCWDCEDRDKK